NLLAAITQLIQTQQGLADTINMGGNANINANTQNVPNNNANNNVSKISIRIPTYRGEPKENVVAWLLQVQKLQQQKIMHSLPIEIVLQQLSAKHFSPQLSVLPSSATQETTPDWGLKHATRTEIAYQAPAALEEA
ncbi:13550_t:CDS:2, partial [Racocetra persica]